MTDMFFYVRIKIPRESHIKQNSQNRFGKNITKAYNTQIINIHNIAYI